MLASQIEGMGLDVGTTIGLTSRLNAIELKLELGRDVCGELGGFVRRVTDEAGKAHSSLTAAQAEAIVTAASSVEGQLGC